MPLSFSGCGFMGIYHVGVGIALKKYAPQLLFDKICGVSAGAMVACGIICDLPIRPESDFGDVLTPLQTVHERTIGYNMISDIIRPITSVPHFNNMKTLSNMTFDIFKITDDARKMRFFGACSLFFPVNEILSKSMSRVLPLDADMRVNKKLHVSLTRVKDKKNFVKSEYCNRQELIATLLASTYIPIFSGFSFPEIDGIKYIDGGFTDNLVMLDQETITITPFCGEHDICPTDDSSHLFYINFNNTLVELSRQNLVRFTNIVHVPDRDYLTQIFKNGFLDAYEFLTTKNLIICNRCLYLTSRYVIAEVTSTKIEDDPKCRNCQMEYDSEVYSTMDNGQKLLQAQQNFLDLNNNQQPQLKKY